MSVASLIAYMRRREADLADTTITLIRPYGTGVFDPAKATYGPRYTPTIYEGAALVRPAGDTVVEAGETAVDVTSFDVKFPSDTDVQIGDIVTVTASEHDAGLVGMTLRVVDPTNDEWQICRRARCVVETGMPT